MNSEQLRYFIIAAKHLNFSAAAKELYVTQPAISHQIAALEQELGTTLLKRSTRKIQLTKSGELFLEDAKRLLDMESTARQRIKLAEESRDYKLKIAYLLAPCQTFLPKLLYQFRREYPQVELILSRMDARLLAEQLPKEDQDIYFSMIRDFESPSLTYMSLFADTFCLICNEDHPCALANGLDFDKVASETFLMLDPTIGPYMAKEIQQICREKHFVPHNIKYMGSMEEILFSIEAGLGITILPSKNQTLYPGSLVYLPIQDTDKAHFGAGWFANHTNPAIHWFLDMLTDSLKQHPEWYESSFSLLP